MFAKARLTLERTLLSDHDARRNRFVKATAKTAMQNNNKVPETSGTAVIIPLNPPDPLNGSGLMKTLPPVGTPLTNVRDTVPKKPIGLPITEMKSLDSVRVESG